MAPGLDVDIPDGATTVAVLLHPHPDMGGDRFNHVVSALYLGLPRAGIGAVRFDFGSSDVERCAQETVAAIDGVGRPVVLVGYSFGSMVAARVTDERVLGWCLVAPPIDHLDQPALANDPRPKLLLAPEHDQFTPAGRVSDVAATWASTGIEVVAGADHFVGPAAAGIVASAADWLHDL